MEKQELTFYAQLHVTYTRFLSIGSDGDDSYLKFIIKFRKKVSYIFKLYFMRLFSADATMFFLNKFFAPQNIKELPSKVAHNLPSFQSSKFYSLKFSHLGSCQTLQDEKIA